MPAGWRRADLALDWLVGTGDLHHKTIAVLSASSTHGGGANAQQAIGQTLRAHGANIVGTMQVPSAKQKFEAGRLVHDVWRLSADLKKRSTLSLDTKERNWAAFDVVPTTGDQALLATDFGLATVSLPSPGQPGQATGSLPIPANVPRGATPTQLAVMGREIAVLEHPEVSTLNPRIVIDGQPGLAYDVGSAGRINSMSAGSAGLWLTTNSTVDQRGLLVLLDNQLRPIAPGPVAKDPDLGVPETVMASGRTVWLTTSGGRDRFVCFVSDNKSGARAAIAVDPEATLLAVTPDEVFVSEQNGISGYRVPDACR